MLKSYDTRDVAKSLHEKEEYSVHPIAVLCDNGRVAEQQDDLEGSMESETPLFSARLTNSETLANLSSFLAHLNTDQREDVVKLLSKFSSILGDVPTLTNV